MCPFHIRVRKERCIGSSGVKTETFNVVRVNQRYTAAVMIYTITATVYMIKTFYNEFGQKQITRSVGVVCENCTHTLALNVSKQTVFG